MIMTAELDAGPIVARWAVELTGRETTPELEARLADLAATVVPGQLEGWAAGSAKSEPQDESMATHVRPFTRADGWIDWRRPAIEIDRQVRALQPWPGAWTTLDDRRLHVRRARPVSGVDAVPIGALLPGDEPRVACGVGGWRSKSCSPRGARRCRPKTGYAGCPASTSSSAPDAPRSWPAS
jgi:methionyl-tRNA formyltransferase